MAVGALFGERVTLGQARGLDVKLIVYGDEFYARYETPEGYAVIYDEPRGLFCYASLREGRFVSSGVPLAAPPPPAAVRHAEEAPAVRLEKAARRAARQSPPPDVTRVAGPGGGKTG
jgi:hypothetical protein